MVAVCGMHMYALYFFEKRLKLVFFAHNWAFIWLHFYLLLKVSKKNLREQMAKDKNVANIQIGKQIFSTLSKAPKKLKGLGSHFYVFLFVSFNAKYSIFFC